MFVGGVSARSSEKYGEQMRGDNLYLTKNEARILEDYLVVILNDLDTGIPDYKILQSIKRKILLKFYGD
jgi:hypothetical protein